MQSIYMLWQSIYVLPLLFMQDRKQVYFTDDDLALFQRQFAPYGVSADQFFALMQTGQWHVAEPGATLVRQASYTELPRPCTPAATVLHRSCTAAAPQLHPGRRGQAPP